MRRYLILIEPTPTGFSAYSPDLPGCVATGATRSDVDNNMREAVELHVGEFRAHGEPVPRARRLPTWKSPPDRRGILAQHKRRWTSPASEGFSSS